MLAALRLLLIFVSLKVGEGHLILKTCLNQIQWTSEKAKSKSQLYSVMPLPNNQQTAKILELYKESCALLGGFHIL